MSNYEWPPENGLTTPGLPRERTAICLIGSTHINAPASQVFDIIRNTGDYSQWNSFCPKVTIRSQPEEILSNSTMLENGTSFTFHVVLNPNKPNSQQPTALKVIDISTPDSPSSYVPKHDLENDGSYYPDLSKLYRIVWVMEGFMTNLVQAERFHEVISLGENECEVRTWDSQGGAMAFGVKWMYEKALREAFARYAVELKKFAEGKAKSAS
jgi:hypothetical protein